MSKISLFDNLSLQINGHLFARRYRMTFVISIEVIVFAFLLIIIIPEIHHWSIIMMLVAGILASFLNLMALKKYKCVSFSSYLFTGLFYLITTGANFIAGGITTSLFVWFYMVPLIAATLIGFRGLVLFGGLTVVTIMAFLILPHEPFFKPQPSQLWSIELMNFSFMLILVLSVLTAFLIEIYYFEKKTIAQQEALEKDREKLLHLSHHDILTKLPNRNYLYAELKRKIKKNQSVSIFFMDLNGFKSINDRYGHDIGDQVLVETAKRIGSCFRNEDFVARVGGDEFVGVIAYSKEKGIYKKVEERIRDTFNHPYRSIKMDIHLSIAIGIAQYPLDATDTESLITIADKRMYEDKQRIKESEP